MLTTALSGETPGARCAGAGLQKPAADAKTPVFLIFTSTNRTSRALEPARMLAERAGAGLEVVALQTVPYPLPLDKSLPCLLDTSPGDSRN